MADGETRSWVEHSRMSDPGRYGPALSGLPVAVASLARIVQGLLIHGEELHAYGLAEPAAGPAPRTTLPVADRIADILARDARPLDDARPPARRSIGTCRDYALLLCCFLRQGGVPARVRCGFAAYIGDGWRDHWVCEVWDRTRAVWRVGDAQMDDVLRDRYAVAFDPADVPQPLFRTAAEAWSDVRAGLADPARHGHGATTGPWFMKVNVVRDHLALNGHEISAWDGWRECPPALRVVTAEEVDRLDRIAARPDLPSGDLVPDWRARRPAAG